jgi:hypothetical protein
MTKHAHPTDPSQLVGKKLDHYIEPSRPDSNLLDRSLHRSTPWIYIYRSESNSVSDIPTARQRKPNLISIFTDIEQRRPRIPEIREAKKNPGEKKATSAHLPAVSLSLSIFITCPRRSP